MSLHKILASFTVGGVLMVLAVNAIDNRYGISSRLASYLP